MQTGGEFEGLDTYISEAHELNAEDIAAITVEADKATALWNKIEPLRHRFYAHHQMLTDAQRDALFKNVTYDELENLVQILLNISFVLEQAEINGRHPDLSQDYTGPINRAEGEVERLYNLIA